MHLIFGIKKKYLCFVEKPYSVFYYKLCVLFG
jgi:hypothetical protein